ncbi:hypothetical protein OAF54_03180, partial [bacterium]|nr:hypothetical protein [bacterium]
MLLKDYIDAEHGGSKLAFVRASKLSIQTVYNLYEGKSMPHKTTADRIYEATNGLVKRTDLIEAMKG